MTRRHFLRVLLAVAIASNCALSSAFAISSVPEISPASEDSSEPTSLFEGLEFSVDEANIDAADVTSVSVADTGIATVYITSNDPVNYGRNYIDGSRWHETSAPGSIRVVSANNTERYSGAISSIKGRGNTSWEASKKGYQVKLNAKADLMDPTYHSGVSEPSKKWILIGNPFDPTLLRHEICYRLAKEIGLKYAIDCEPVNLFYDNEYRGSYLLTEKIEIGKGRVDIADLEKDIEGANTGINLDGLPTCRSTTSYGCNMQYVDGLREPDDSSGGYLLELDCMFFASEKSWVSISNGTTFVSKSPEYLTYNQLNYVGNLMEEAFVCLRNHGVNPNTHKTLFDYFDKESIVKYVFLQAFSKNSDAFTSSTYFYIPKGERKIYAGPLWDCDGAFGARVEREEMQSTAGWCSWNEAQRFFECGDFIKALVEMYDSDIKGPLEKLINGAQSSPNSFSSLVARNEKSSALNRQKWGLGYPFVLYKVLPTYEENISFLQGWLKQRLAWVDGQINYYKSTESDSGTPMFRLYNPYTSEHFYTASQFENDTLAAYHGWNAEGVGWTAPSTGEPVYRLYNPGLGDHHYTTNAAEKDMLVAGYGWNYEGIGWYSGGSTPMYRLYNGRLKCGQHFYTASAYEAAILARDYGWTYEGIGYYAK